MEMPLIGLGTWNLKGEECIKVVENAIKLGYRHIDTAKMYGNEYEVGIGIKNSNVIRSEIFITTKLCNPFTTPKMIDKGVYDSLKKLNVDYLDLVLIHEPYQNYIEIYQELEKLHTKGLIKYIGISNFNRYQLNDLLSNCKIKPYVNQIENHVFYQRNEYVKFLQEKGIKVVAWSPLCADVSRITRNSVIKTIAERYNTTPVKVALKFLLQRGIYIIPKSKNLERLIENLTLFNFSLTDEDMKKLMALDKGKSLFGWYND